MREVEGLTWGILIDGKQVTDAFLALGCSIQPSDVVPEIGSGYRRVYETFRNHFQFKRWCMVEISPERCTLLKDKFRSDSGVEVLCQDANELLLPEKFNIGISTLTFKYPYADFSQALTRLAMFMRNDGTFLFDMHPPYEDRRVDESHVDIVNYYSSQSLQDLITLSGFRIESVGKVQYENAQIRPLQTEKSDRTQLDSTSRILLDVATDLISARARS